MRKNDCVKSVKLPQELADKIKAWCLENSVKSESAFFRYAVAKIVTPDIKDQELTYESLRQLHEKIGRIEDQQEILMAYLSHQYRNLLAYHDELPEDKKRAAALSANDRFDKFFKYFRDALSKTPGMFERLLADYYEEHGEEEKA
jgi:Arc/MetJ-type ribon-helix-helix transcriptional regulator